jgi:hypothetical protein
VKTISEPLTKPHKYFAKWQEASRKDVERAFAVLQRKFQFLVKAVEQWYIKDITTIVQSCIILHNMMVEVRLNRDEEEDYTWYDFNNNINDNNNNINENNNNINENNNSTTVDPAIEFVERQEPERALHQRLQEAFYDGPAVDVDDNNYKRRQELLNFRQEVINRRWDCLYSKTEHFELRDTIINQLQRNKK